MSPRLPLLLALLALSRLAGAAYSHVGNPPGLRAEGFYGHVGNPPGVRGWVSGYKLVGRHGRSVHVQLPKPAPLTAPLALPPGSWADLVLELDGPLTVVVDGGPPVSVQVDQLTVPVEDPSSLEGPGGGAVRFSWSLPEGVISALQVGLVPADLSGRLEDGALAVTDPGLGLDAYNP